MSADPIVQEGSFYPGDLDSTLEAIAQSIRDADAALPDFTEANVIVTDPEETAQEIDQKIKRAIQKAKGIALLVVCDGVGENADSDGETPRVVLDLELQLYLAKRRTRRSATAARPQDLCAALAKHLHHRAVRVQGTELYDEITFRRWAPIADEEYNAWTIHFDRELQL